MRLSRYLDIGKSLVVWACILLYVVMIALTFIQVFFRYVVGKPFTTTEELARYTFVWLVLLGSAVTMWSEGHIRLTFLVERLPSRVIRGLEILCDTFIAALVLKLFIFEGFSLAQKTMLQLSPATDIPIGWIYLSIPVSGSLMFLATLGRITTKMLNFTKGEPGDSAKTRQGPEIDTQ